jgi:hypothetical protein
MSQISSFAINMAGGPQLGVAGAGILNPATGIVAVPRLLASLEKYRQARAATRHAPAPAEGTATPIAGDNPVAARFLPQSDILVMGVQPWIKRNRGPRHYVRLNAINSTLQPMATAKPSPVTAAKALQSAVQPAPDEPELPAIVNVAVTRFPWLADRPAPTSGRRRQFPQHAMSRGPG